jgi:NhaP-type Na+/H+ or K+/H+ antiporter
MRGVVALAAAMSLPLTVADGTQFPQRNLVVFLTFSVILVTLVFQGLTLPPLIRMLGLAGDSGSHPDEQEARRLVLEAALAYLKSHRASDSPDSARLYDDLAQRYRRRLTILSGHDDEGVESDRAHYTRYLDLSRKLLDVERQTALHLRDAGRINDDVLRQLEHELDLSETRLKVAIDRQT